MSYTIDREALAWAAGFFDGEGSTCLRTDRRRARGNTELLLTITQHGTPPEELLRFQAAVLGLGNVHGPFAWNGERVRYTYTANGRERVPAILAMLWPWLSSAKKAQALVSVAAVRADVREWRAPRPITERRSG